MYRLLFASCNVTHHTQLYEYKRDAFKLKLTSAVTQFQLSVTEHTGEGSQVISEENRALWRPNLRTDPSPLTFLFRPSLKH